jgi:Big-like domain-containing protein
VPDFVVIDISDNRLRRRPWHLDHTACSRLLCIGGISVFIDFGELGAGQHKCAAERVDRRIEWIQWICLSINIGFTGRDIHQPGVADIGQCEFVTDVHCSVRLQYPYWDSQLTLHATSGSLAHDATITLSINPPVQTSQTGTVLYLQSYSTGHTARIGLETAWGGSIVEVSLDGTNFVNAHDTGREVQAALYDGAAQYDNCAGCTGVFGWNPVLGGDRYDHGSPVLTQQVATESLYVKAQPLQWYPDDKGGGPTTPVLADAYFEQTVSVVPGAPLAFRVHFTLTHLGTDHHYNAWQEFPAVYVNSAYGTLVSYGGTAAWTRDVVTKTSVPASPRTLIPYSPERWAANVDSNNVGLSVFAPTNYPYVIATWFPGSGGSGPTGDATYYQRPFSVSTIGPGAVIDGDVYLIAGDSASARDIVYGLHQLLAASDIFAPMGNLDTPAANTTISGNNVQISGWAFDDTAVSNVSVFVDDALQGNAVYGSNRADVATVWPHAPTQCGWRFSLDSTQLTNGAHTITIHATDSSNNEAILAPISVTVSN